MQAVLQKQNGIQKLVRILVNTEDETCNPND